MRILMVSRSVYATDVRVRREAETLAAAGHEIRVLCLGESASPDPHIHVRGVGRPLGLTGRRPARRSLPYRAIRWALLPTHRRRALAQFAASVGEEWLTDRWAPDAVHAHDFPALEPSAKIAEQSSAALVYDSHEFWPGVLTQGRPQPWIDRHEASAERNLAKRAGAVLTVSEGAAALLNTHLGRTDVQVVKNTFRPRHDLTPPDAPSGAVYAGRIGSGRDLETVFASGFWRSNPSIRLLLIGDGDGTVDVPEYARLHASGPLDEVDRLLAATGIGLVPLTRGPLNHDIALPNKLFQSVSVGVPVVAADLPEMRATVDRLGIGVTYEPGDPDSFSTALDRLIDEYPRYRDGAVAAQTELTWQQDERTLLAIYRKLGA